MEIRKRKRIKSTISESLVEKGIRMSNFLKWRVKNGMSPLTQSEYQLIRRKI